MKNNFKTIVILIILFLICLGVLFFLVSYNKKNKEKLFELKKDFLMQSELPEKNDIEKRKNELLSKQKEAEEFLFDKNNPIELIESIEKISSQNSLETIINDASFVEDEDSKYNNSLKVSISASGTFTGINNFVEEIEDIRKEVKIDSLTFFKVEKEDAIFWKADLILVGKTK